MFERRKQRKKLESMMYDEAIRTLEQAKECIPGSATHTNMVEDVMKIWEKDQEREKNRNNVTVTALTVGGPLVLGALILNYEKIAPVVTKAFSMIHMPGMNNKIR